MKVQHSILVEDSVHQRKYLVLILVKQPQNFVRVCFIMLISYFLVIGKEIFKFKTGNKNVNFPTQFYLGIISKGFSANESREASLNGNVYDFAVDYNFIDKSDILNIHKYLRIKNNIKNVQP